MDKLITVIPAKDVTDEYQKEAKTWTKWDSKNRKKFPYNYSQEERVLVLSGSATLTPLLADGTEGDPIVLESGMGVIFHVGFKCKWLITQRMKKHYAVFASEDDDEEVAPEDAITCDVCSKGCLAESYYVVQGDEELDICPTCFGKDKKKYAGAEHQKEGKKWVEPKKKAKASEGPKKKKQKK